MVRSTWVVLGLFACSPAANAVRPADPSYAKAMGETCNVGGGAAQPLVVDWRSDARTDLEVAMRRGVVVVAYDCNHLRVLDDCTADGGYAFVPVTPKTQQLKLANKDEIKANLPAGVVAASASVQRGASLDVNLSIVGKQTSTVAGLDGRLLRGRCEGATHFVRAVTTGAFTLATHTDAQTDGKLEVRGVGASANGSSDKQLEVHDGDPAACAQASPTSVAPPRGCATPLRLDLVALGAAAASNETPASVRPEVAACPPGMSWHDGVCRTAPAHDLTCTSSAAGAEQCRQRCDAQDWAACTNLGVAYTDGRVVPLDRPQALKLFERACHGGEPAGCHNVGAMLIRGNGVPADPTRAVSLLLESCYGEAAFCANVAIAYRDGVGTPRNLERAAEMFSRACLGGVASACFDLSQAYQNGNGVPGDQARAVELESQACTGGFLRACSLRGARFLQGRGVPHDEAKAFQYARYACDRREPLGCTVVAHMMMGGLGGLARDVRGGLDIMREACNNDTVGASCEIYAGALWDQHDLQRAREANARACKLGAKTACTAGP